MHLDPSDAATALLDRSGPTWLGSLPGLGSLAVDPDGAVRVAPDGPDPTGEKATALTYGWGELLSCARRGYSLVLGSAIAPPDSSEGALLVCGGAHDVATISIALSRLGWSLISDRPTATSWVDGRLTAHPRPAPLVMSRDRAEAAGLAWAPVRTRSNAVAVEIARGVDPLPVGGLLLVQRRRRDEQSFAELTGQRKFERAASLMVGGVLAPEPGADDSAVSEHLRIAELPSAVIRVDGADVESVDPLLAWWAR